MKRKSRNAKERARLFNLFEGKCYLCKGQIDGTKEAWEIEHVIPIAQGGEDEDSNLQLAHAKCHKAKTAEDMGNIARAKRREARHTGAKVSSGSFQRKPKFRRPSKPRPARREIYKDAS